MCRPFRTLIVDSILTFNPSVFFSFFPHYHHCHPGFQSEIGKKFLASSGNPSNHDVPHKMSRSPPRSSFMVLPAEVRHMIYGLCLQEPTDSVRVILNEKGKVKLEPQPGSFCTTSPQVLVTCRQIHAEALPVFSGKNNLVVNEVGIAEGFINQIPITYISLVEDFMVLGTLDWTYEHLNRLTRCIMAMPGLKSLRVSIFVKFWMFRRRTPDNAARLATVLLKRAAFLTRHHPRLHRVSQYRTSDDTVREFGFDLVEADHRLDTEPTLLPGCRKPRCTCHTEWDVDINAEAELEMLKKKRRTLEYVMGFDERGSKPLLHKLATSAVKHQDS